MNKKTLILPLILLLAISTTLATTNITSCGSYTTPDTYILQNNITATSTCLSMGSNTIIDGNGYTIDATGSSRVIYLAWAVANVEIKNLNIINIQKYDDGIRLQGGNTGTHVHNVNISGVTESNIVHLFQQTNSFTFNDNTFNGGLIFFNSPGTPSGIFYNNIMPEIEVVYALGTHNLNNIQWNTTQTLGTSIVGGNYIAGNYWTANTGCTDTDYDNICDDIYNYTTLTNAHTVIDYLPLDTGNFCDPNWVCNGYDTCNVDTQSQPCNSVADTNLCFEPYTGNYTEFPDQDCYAPGGTEAEDLPKIIIDGLGGFGVFMISMIALIALTLLFVWGRQRIKK